MGVQGRKNKALSTTLSSWVMSSKPLVKQGMKHYLPVPFVGGNYPQTSYVCNFSIFCACDEAQVDDGSFLLPPLISRSPP